MSDSSNMPTVFDYDQNIADAEAPPPLPLGTYRGVIKAVEVVASKKDPSSYNAKVTFHISPDQYPATYSEGDPDGFSLFQYVALGNKPITRFMLRKFCEAIHAPMGRQIDTTQWIGLDAMVKVTHEEYEGRFNARIDRNGLTPA